MRIRRSYRTKTWKEARILIEDIAHEFDLSLEEREDIIVAIDEKETMKISVFFDPRGFGFVKTAIPQDRVETIDQFIRNRIHT